MKVTIVAMGKLKAKYALLATDDFLKRASRFFKIEHIEVKDVRRGRSSSHQDWRVEEAEALLKHVPKNAVLIALDEHGKQRNSTEFSRWIETLKVRGHSHIVFALGGPDGHGKDLLEAAQHKVSLSQMTMTHELARIVLFEQLYRAGSLLAGHPYHRD